MALDAPAIFMRTKALRALGQIVTSDASVLSFVSLHLPLKISFSNVLILV